MAFTDWLAQNFGIGGAGQPSVKAMSALPAPSVSPQSFASQAQAASAMTSPSPAPWQPAATSQPQMQQQADTLKSLIAAHLQNPTYAPAASTPSSTSTFGAPATVAPAIAPPTNPAQAALYPHIIAAMTGAGMPMPSTAGMTGQTPSMNFPLPTTANQPYNGNDATLTSLDGPVGAPYTPNTITTVNQGPSIGDSALGQSAQNNYNIHVAQAPLGRIVGGVYNMGDKIVTQDIPNSVKNISSGVEGATQIASAIAQSPLAAANAVDAVIADKGGQLGNNINQNMVQPWLSSGEQLGKDVASGDIGGVAGDAWSMAKAGVYPFYEMPYQAIVNSPAIIKPVLSALPSVPVIGTMLGVFQKPYQWATSNVGDNLYAASTNQDSNFAGNYIWDHWGDLAGGIHSTLGYVDKALGTDMADTIIQTLQGAADPGMLAWAKDPANAAAIADAYKRGGGDMVYQLYFSSTHKDGNALNFFYNNLIARSLADPLLVLNLMHGGGATLAGAADDASHVSTLDLGARAETANTELANAQTALAADPTNTALQEQVKQASWNQQVAEANQKVGQENVANGQDAGGKAAVLRAASNLLAAPHNLQQALGDLPFAAIKGGYGLLPDVVQNAIKAPFEESAASKIRTEQMGGVQPMLDVNRGYDDATRPTVDLPTGPGGGGTGTTGANPNTGGGGGGGGTSPTSPTDPAALAKAADDLVTKTAADLDAANKAAAAKSQLGSPESDAAIAAAKAHQDALAAQRYYQANPGTDVSYQASLGTPATTATADTTASTTATTETGSTTPTTPAADITPKPVTSRTGVQSYVLSTDDNPSLQVRVRERPSGTYTIEERDTSVDQQWRSSRDANNAFVGGYDPKSLDEAQTVAQTVYRDKLAAKTSGAGTTTADTAAATTTTTATTATDDATNNAVLAQQSGLDITPVSKNGFVRTVNGRTYAAARDADGGPWTIRDAVTGQVVEANPTTIQDAIAAIDQDSVKPQPTTATTATTETKPTEPAATTKPLGITWSAEGKAGLVDTPVGQYRLARDDEGYLSVFTPEGDWMGGHSGPLQDEGQYALAHINMDLKNRANNGGKSPFAGVREEPDQPTQPAAATATTATTEPATTATTEPATTATTDTRTAKPVDLKDGGPFNQRAQFNPQVTAKLEPTTAPTTAAVDTAPTSYVDGRYEATPIADKEGEVFYHVINQDTGKKLGVFRDRSVAKEHIANQIIDDEKAPAATTTQPTTTEQPTTATQPAATQPTQPTQPETPAATEATRNEPAAPVDPDTRYANKDEIDNRLPVHQGGDVNGGHADTDYYTIGDKGDPYNEGYEIRTKFDANSGQFEGYDAARFGEVARYHSLPGDQSLSNFLDIIDDRERQHLPFAPLEDSDQLPGRASTQPTEPAPANPAPTETTATEPYGKAPDTSAITQQFTYDGVKPVRVQGATEAIAEVHNPEPGAGVTVRSNPDMSGAVYRYDPNTHESSIILGDKPFPGQQTSAQFNFVHEYGHYVDDQMLGGYSERMTDPRYKNIVTDGNRELTNDERQLWTTIQDSPQVQDWRQTGGYDADPRELFARAYTQWIIEKASENTVLDGDLALVQRAGRAWPDAEFQPISEAMDKVFADNKLLKNQPDEAAATATDQPTTAAQPATTTPTQPTTQPTTTVTAPGRTPFTGMKDDSTSTTLATPEARSAYQAEIDARQAQETAARQQAEAAAKQPAETPPADTNTPSQATTTRVQENPTVKATEPAPAPAVHPNAVYERRARQVWAVNPDDKTEVLVPDLNGKSDYRTWQGARDEVDRLNAAREARNAPPPTEGETAAPAAPPAGKAPPQSMLDFQKKYPHGLQGAAGYTDEYEEAYLAMERDTSERDAEQFAAALKSGGDPYRNTSYTNPETAAAPPETTTGEPEGPPPSRLGNWTPAGNKITPIVTNDDSLTEWYRVGNDRNSIRYIAERGDRYDVYTQLGKDKLNTTDLTADQAKAFIDEHFPNPTKIDGMPGTEPTAAPTEAPTAAPETEPLPPIAFQKKGTLGSQVVDETSRQTVKHLTDNGYLDDFADRDKLADLNMGNDHNLNIREKRSINDAWERANKDRAAASPPTEAPTEAPAAAAPTATESPSTERDTGVTSTPTEPAAATPTQTAAPSAAIKDVLNRPLVAHIENLRVENPVGVEKFETAVKPVADRIAAQTSDLQAKIDDANQRYVDLIKRAKGDAENGIAPDPTARRDTPTGPNKIDQARAEVNRLKIDQHLTSIEGTIDAARTYGKTLGTLPENAIAVEDHLRVPPIAGKDDVTELSRGPNGQPIYANSPLGNNVTSSLAYKGKSFLEVGDTSESRYLRDNGDGTWDVLKGKRSTTPINETPLSRADALKKADAELGAPRVNSQFENTPALLQKMVYRAAPDAEEVLAKRIVDKPQFTQSGNRLPMDPNDITQAQFDRAQELKTQYAQAKFASQDSVMNRRDDPNNMGIVPLSFKQAEQVNNWLFGRRSSDVELRDTMADMTTEQRAAYDAMPWLAQRLVDRGYLDMPGAMRVTRPILGEDGQITTMLKIYDDARFNQMKSGTEAMADALRADHVDIQSGVTQADREFIASLSPAKREALMKRVEDGAPLSPSQKRAYDSLSIVDQNRYGGAAAKILRKWDGLNNVAKENMQFNFPAGIAGATRNVIQDSFTMGLTGHTTASFRLLRDIPTILKIAREGNPALLRDLPGLQAAREAGIDMPAPFSSTNFTETAQGMAGNYDSFAPGGAPTMRMKGWIDKKASIESGSGSGGDRFTRIITTPFASQLMKNVRSALQSSSKMHVFEDQLRDLNPQLYRSFETNLMQSQGAARASQIMDDIHAEAQRRLAGEPNAGKYLGGFSQADVLNATGDTQLARSLQGGIKDSAALAQKEAERVFFTYKQTRLDQSLSHGIMFNYWASRQSMLFADIALHNPFLVATMQRVWTALGQDAQQTGASNRLQAYLHLMGNTPYGMGWLVDPLRLLVPMQYFQSTSNPNDPWWKRYGVILTPLAAGAAAIGGATNDVPNLFGVDAVTRELATLMDGMKAYGKLPGGMNFTPDLSESISKSIIKLGRDSFRSIADHFGAKNAIAPYSPYNFTGSETASVRALIHQYATQDHGPEYGQNGLMHWDSKTYADVRAADLAAGQGGDHMEDNHYSKRAYEEYAKAKAAGSALNLVIPTSIRTNPLDAMKTSAAAGQTALSAGLTPTVAQNNDIKTKAQIEKATTGGYDLSIQNDFANTIPGSYNAQGKFYHDAYDAIVYGGNRPASYYIDPQFMKDNGYLADPSPANVNAYVASMKSPADRQAFFSTYLTWADTHGHQGAQAHYDQYTADKTQVIAGLPEESAFHDWQTNIGKIKANPALWRQYLQQNPGYNDYIQSFIKSLPPATRNDPALLDSAVASASSGQNAYWAAFGQKGSVYDSYAPKMGADPMGTLLLSSVGAVNTQGAVGAPVSGGGGSNPTAGMTAEQITSKYIDAYNKEIANFDLALQSYTHNPNIHFSNLNPYERVAYESALMKLGIIKPRLNLVVKRYLYWLNSGAANGTDRSVHAFSQWVQGQHDSLENLTDPNNPLAQIDYGQSNSMYPVTATGIINQQPMAGWMPGSTSLGSTPSGNSIMGGGYQGGGAPGGYTGYGGYIPTNDNNIMNGVMGN